jgi:hypothetical protein
LDCLDSARSQRALERSIRRFIHRLIAIKTFPSGSFDVDAAHIVSPAQLEPLFSSQLACHQPLRARLCGKHSFF